MRETKGMTEISKTRELKPRGASSKDSVDCNWATGVVPKTLLAAGQDSLERFHQTTRELLDFWRGRIECFGDASRRIATCRSIEEMQQIQGRYIQDMTSAHAAMWSKLPTLLLICAMASDDPSVPEGSIRVA
jgi:hypothetical protein